MRLLGPVYHLIHFTGGLVHELLERFQQWLHLHMRLRPADFDIAVASDFDMRLHFLMFSVHFNDELIDLYILFNMLCNILYAYFNKCFKQSKINFVLFYISVKIIHFID